MQFNAHFLLFVIGLLASANGAVVVERDMVKSTMFKPVDNAMVERMNVAMVKPMMAKPQEGEAMVARMNAAMVKPMEGAAMVARMDSNMAKPMDTDAMVERMVKPMGVAMAKPMEGAVMVARMVEPVVACESCHSNAARAVMVNPMEGEAMVAGMKGAMA